MRALAILGLVLAFAGSSQAATRQHPYVKQWKQKTYGKHALARVGAGAGWKTLRHGGGAAGFGKRLGTGFATHGVKTTVEHVIAARLHEDLHYHRSNKHGVFPRLRHALVSTVVTRNTRNGKRRPATGRISGHAAAGAVSQGLLAGASEAATAGIGLAATAGVNVACEFWPRH